MDGSTFDRIARGLGEARSRRTVIGALAAGVLGLAGGRRADAARCRDGGATCREHGDCCSGTCGTPDARGRRTCAPLLLANGASCTASSQCLGGACACRSLTCAEAICATTVANSPGPCGSNFHTTPEGQANVCVAGAGESFDCTSVPCPSPAGICRADLICFEITF
jgi:hypothetical protein